MVATCEANVKYYFALFAAVGGLNQCLTYGSDDVIIYI